MSQKLLETFPDERFYTFFGPMGVGKTTLIKELCLQLGVAQNVCSPTFAIINEYSDRNGTPVYHFDFYRLKSLDDAYNIGYEEYFWSGDWCFVEWPEKIEPLLPDRYLRVEMTEDSGHRTLKAFIASSNDDKLEQ